MTRIVGIDVGATCGVVRLMPTGGWGATGPFLYEGSAATRDVFASGLIRDVDVLAVEGVSGAVYNTGDGMGAALSRGKALMVAARLSGRLEQWARDHSVEHHEYTARDVRKAMCGRANADDAMVALVVRSRVVDWPARSNAHERDAALVAIYTWLTICRVADARETGT